MISLIALLDRRHDLLRHHQVRAVADHHEHLARRIGHLHAQPAGDLVAHARVAVLEVIRVRLARAPQLVEIARQAARRTDHHVLRPRERIRPRRPARSGRTAARVARADVRRSTSACHSASRRVDRPPIVSVVVNPSSACRDFLERDARVGHHRDGRVLERVHLADVDRDEAHIRMRERGLRHRREVATDVCRWRSRGRRRARADWRRACR